MTVMQTPSKQVLSNLFDGQEITDSAGRKIRLKKPNVLDKYDLFSALGDDSKNMMCLTYALPILHIATIDGMVIEAPKSYAQFRATLQRVGDDGIDAVSKFMASVDESNSDKEIIEKVKK